MAANTPHIATPIRDAARRARTAEQAALAARGVHVAPPAGNPAPAAAPVRLIRLPEVLRRTGLGRATMYELIAKGQFPKQVRLSPRTVAWLESEVELWIAERIAASGKRA